MLNVNLLGGASFFVNGVVVKSDLGPVGRLLACYLLEFFGRVHRREQLADFFGATRIQTKHDRHLTPPSGASVRYWNSARKEQRDN